MKLSICTDVFGKIPFTEMLDKVVAYGLDAIEMTAGGWGGCNFIPSAEELINDDAKREAFLAEITKRGLAISALNCSGNPLIDTPMGKMHSKTMRDTMVLAGKMGVDTVVTMSGLPAGAPGDKTPNWFVSTISWPEYEGFNYMAEGVKYQWKVAGEWWKETCRIAKEAGVKKIAIEEFPGALVHNVRTFNQLCEAVGEDSDVLGLNLDPSHLMIQGAEPIEAHWARRSSMSTARMPVSRSTTPASTASLRTFLSSAAHSATGTMSQSAAAETCSGGKSSSQSAI